MMVLCYCYPVKIYYFNPVLKQKNSQQLSYEFKLKYVNFKS